MANNNWTGKTVWLTGASSGIGKMLALKLAKLGCTVVISARREEALIGIAEHAPQQILPLAVDVSDTGQRDNVREQLAARVESIDIALFVAGVVEYEDDLSFDIERYKKVFDVNFFGLVNSVAIAMPLLKKSEHKPYIVGVTSLTVLTGFPRAEIYGASKAAADYFLKALRMDLDPEKFDLSIVRPGFVKTPMTSVNDFPMPFILSADNAADRIIDAMNKRRLFINFPRRFSFLLKLLSSVPSIWYRILAPKMNRHQNK
ncbi:MAG: short-subunit dehydrogenase [Cellvibrionaceae bacterium]|jgi:short-subunit dehydrogenase